MRAVDQLFAHQRGRARLATAVAVLIALLMVAFPATGDDNPGDFSPYLSVAGIYVTDLFEDDLEDELSDAFGPINVDIEETGGITARAGLRFFQFVSVEVQYDWLAPYDVDFDIPGLVGDETTVEVEQQHTLTANLRLTAPLGPIHPYVLAGIGFQHIELDGTARLGPVLTIRERVDDTVLAGRVGAGVEFMLTNHIGIFVEGLVLLTNEELNIAGQEVDNIFYAGGGAGLTYRF